MPPSRAKLAPHELADSPLAILLDPDQQTRPARGRFVVRKRLRGEVVGDATVLPASYRRWRLARQRLLVARASQGERLVAAQKWLDGTSKRAQNSICPAIERSATGTRLAGVEDQGIRKLDRLAHTLDGSILLPARQVPCFGWPGSSVSEPPGAGCGFGSPVLFPPTPCGLTLRTVFPTARSSRRHLPVNAPNHQHAAALLSR